MPGVRKLFRAFVRLCKGIPAPGDSPDPGWGTTFKEQVEALEEKGLRIECYCPLHSLKTTWVCNIWSQDEMELPQGTGQSQLNPSDALRKATRHYESTYAAGDRLIREALRYAGDE